MKKTITLLLSLVLVLSLAACGSGRTGGRTAETEAPEPAETGAETAAPGTAAPAPEETEAPPEEDADEAYLDVMLDAAVTSLDPALAADSGAREVLADCVDGLLQLDEDGAVVPALAESYDVSEDGLTYTFHLREARWSSGTEVTANDFVFAWRRLLETGGEPSRLLGAAGARIKNADAILGEGADPETLGVSAPDEKTLVVELEAPVPYFPAMTALPVFFPVNEEFYTDLADGTYGTGPDAFLSCGAFMPEEWDAGSDTMTLVRNPDYWGADRVTLQGIRYHVFDSDDDAALDAFRDGTMDIVSLRGSQIASAAEDGELSERLQLTGTGELWYLCFRQSETEDRGSALANADLRLAIASAIDREALSDGATALYTAVPSGLAVGADGEDFSADPTPYGDYLGYDTERASSRWEAARSALEEDAFEFGLIYTTDGDSGNEAVAQALKEQIETALSGVILDLQLLDRDAYDQRLEAGDFDIALVHWSPDAADPLAFLAQWTTDAPGSRAFWSSGTYDDLLSGVSSGTYADDSRWDALHEAEAQLLESAVMTPLFTRSRGYLIADGVSGVGFHPADPVRVYKNTAVT